MQARFQQAQKRIEERRSTMERARSMGVHRIQEDVRRIARRECEYAQKLLNVIVPVKISWNEEAWNRIQESMPIRFEPLEPAEAPAAATAPAAAAATAPTGETAKKGDDEDPE